jgi:hypothetical protein
MTISNAMTSTNETADSERIAHGAAIPVNSG